MAGPLKGVRVVDLTRVMAGPFATVMLADLGADVIKVEAAAVGDIARWTGGYQRGGFNALFLALNRGKRSVTVDLRDDEGQQVVRELAATADVFVENFRPGVCDGMGLGATLLRELNPELVYLSISGFGPDSPAAGEPAYDTIIQGRTGMVARQAGPDGQVDLVRSFLVDKLTGFFAVQSILAALYARASGAGGQTISVPMFDATLYYLWPDVLADLAFVGDGVQPGPLASRTFHLTRTADGQLTHLAISDKERAGVARAVGRPDLNDDPRYSTLAGLMERDNGRVYAQAITAGFAGLSTADALDRLRAEGVPCSAVVEPEDLLDDPHVRGTDLLVESDHPCAGRLRQPRYPARFSVTPPDLPAGAPGLGEHTEELVG